MAEAYRVVLDSLANGHAPSFQNADALLWPLSIPEQVNLSMFTCVMDTCIKRVLCQGLFAFLRGEGSVHTRLDHMLSQAAFLRLTFMDGIHAAKDESCKDYLISMQSFSDAEDFFNLVHLHCKLAFMETPLIGPLIDSFEGLNLKVAPAMSKLAVCKLNQGLACLCAQIFQSNECHPGVPEELEDMASFIDIYPTVLRNEGGAAFRAMKASIVIKALLLSAARKNVIQGVNDYITSLAAILHPFSNEHEVPGSVDGHYLLLITSEFMQDTIIVVAS